MQCCQKKDKEIKVRHQAIDLFRENIAAPVVVIKSSVIDADSAFKYCAVAGLATNIKIADSSGAKGFYLYSAVISKVQKGIPKDCKGKQYFISNTKLLPLQDSAVYVFYFLPLVNHNIIKYNLNIKWQWYPDAPFIKGE